MGSKYVPNETRYRIMIPEATIYAFQGMEFYEETLEDDFVYPLLNELKCKYIEHDFSYNAFEADRGFGMELRVDSSQFSDEELIRLLKGTGLVEGLVIWRLEFAQWVQVYGAAE